MPFTFLAHQAPVLPLKMWRPRWFSGAGLVIGSMAPDFDKFLVGRDAGRFGHTLPGQLLFCLPLAAVVYWLLTRVVAAPLARYAPNLGAFHLRDYARALAAPHGTGPIAFVYSVLIGSFTHVLWDGVTHGDPRVVALVPAFAERAFEVGGRWYGVASVHQLAASVLGALFTLWLMRRLGRARAPLRWAGLDPVDPVGAVPEGHARDVVAYWLIVAVTMLVVTVLAVRLALPPSGHWRSTGRFLYALGLRLPLAGFTAVCVAGVIAKHWPRPGAAGKQPVAPPPGRPHTRPTTPSRAL